MPSSVSGLVVGVGWGETQDQIILQPFVEVSCSELRREKGRTTGCILGNGAKPAALRMELSGLIG